MKSIYLIISLIMIPILVNAQKNGEAVVAATNMNVLYRGVVNPIAIAVPGVASEMVTVTMTNGKIHHTDNGWEVFPGDLDESVITVLVNKVAVSDVPFRVLNIPDPVAVFAGIHTGEVTKDVAMKTPGLQVEVKDFLWKTQYIVISFILSYEKDGMTNDLLSNSNRITDSMKALISERSTGEQIVFNEIKAVGPDGKIRALEPIRLSIR